MKLWLLKPEIPWRPHYERVHGFVIRAPDEQTARFLAASKHEDETAAAWLDQEVTSCAEITIDGPEEVILRNYQPG